MPTPRLLRRTATARSATFAYGNPSAVTRTAGTDGVVPREYSSFALAKRSNSVTSVWKVVSSTTSEMDAQPAAGVEELLLAEALERRGSEYERCHGGEFHFSAPRSSRTPLRAARPTTGRRGFVQLNSHRPLRSQPVTLRNLTCLGGQLELRAAEMRVCPRLKPCSLHCHEDRAIEG